MDRTDWQPIETAPRGNTVFLALNHDREVWPCRYDEHGRIQYRTNQAWLPERHTKRRLDDGTEGWVRDVEFYEKNQGWRSDWTLWSAHYNFSPTHWMPLPPPPAPTLETVTDF